MRIVIEVDGEKVTAIGTDTSAVAAAGDIPPGPAPAALLARAKRLGALSAGAAQFGTGAALAAAAPADESPSKSRRMRRPGGGTKRARRSR